MNHKNVAQAIVNHFGNAKLLYLKNELEYWNLEALQGEETVF